MLEGKLLCSQVVPCSFLKLLDVLSATCIVPLPTHSTPLLNSAVFPASPGVRTLGTLEEDSEADVPSVSKLGVVNEGSSGLKRWELAQLEHLQ